MVNLENIRGPLFMATGHKEINRRNNTTCHNFARLATWLSFFFHFYCLIIFLANFFFKIWELPQSCTRSHSGNQKSIGQFSKNGKYFQVFLRSLILIFFFDISVRVDLHACQRLCSFFGCFPHFSHFLAYECRIPTFHPLAHF